MCDIIQSDLIQFGINQSDSTHQLDIIQRDIIPFNIVQSDFIQVDISQFNISEVIYYYLN